jgi:hypothetical protein
MKRPGEVQIDPANPWADDDLERKPVGDVLAAFLRSLEGPFVVAVQGPWGSGKSTFLRRLGFELERQGVPVVLIDAWRNDYLQDPLIAYVSGVNERLNRKKGKANKKIDTIVHGIAEHGVKLCGSLVSVAAKTLLPGSDELYKALAEAVSKVGEDLLALQKEHEKTQSAFRKLLERARIALTGDEKNTPIIVMVDELDRCRPEFAVSALERVKHFFDVPGIIFLLATDGQNLPAAISSVYGERIAAERYLRKFVDFEFHLPPPTAQSYVKYLFRELQLDTLLPTGKTIDGMLQEREICSHHYCNERRGRGYDVADIVAVFPAIAEACELQLRDQSQAFTMIACAIRSAPPTLELLPTILCFCVCLRFSRPETYISLKKGELSLQSLLGTNPSIVARTFLTSPIGISIKGIANAMQHTEHNQRSHIMQSIAAEHQRQHDVEAINAEVQRNKLSVLRVDRIGSLECVKALLSIVEMFAPQIT